MERATFVIPGGMFSYPRQIPSGGPILATVNEQAPEHCSQLARRFGVEAGQDHAWIRGRSDNNQHQNKDKI